MNKTIVETTLQEDETIQEACIRRQQGGYNDSYDEITNDLLIDYDDAINTHVGLITRTTKLKVSFEGSSKELKFNTSNLNDQIPTKIVDERKEKTPPKMKEMPEVNFQDVYPSKYNKDEIQREHFDSATASYNINKTEHEQFNFTISQDGSGYICYYNAESESIRDIQKQGKNIKQIKKTMEQLFNSLKVYVLCLHEQNMKNELIDRMNNIEDQKIRMDMNTMTFKSACVMVLVGNKE